MSISSMNRSLFLESKQGQFTVRSTETPRAGPGEVLVKVEATALNPIDWKIQSLGFFVEKYPAVLGFDAAGAIAQVGEGIPSTSFAIGDRVVIQGWFDFAKKSTVGTFTEYFVLPSKFVAKIPASTSFDEGTTLMSGIATSAFPLYNQDPTAASVRLTAPWLEGGRGKYAGKPFLVLAGAGSVGQFVIQFARLSGFSPIITTASLHNAPFLKSIGATHVLDRNLPNDELIAEATKLAGGPFEVVYDAISTLETRAAAYALTAQGGNLVTVAVAEELMAKAKEDGKGVHMANGLFVTPLNHDIGRTLLDALPALLENGDIKPNRTEILPGGLNGVPDGLQRLKNNQVSGVKLVIHPQDTA
uniref:ATP-dependent RNA helicase CshA (EC) n=1 Tax=Ganoderma boninense TaxID=34458 RepID=A0A5K1K4J9_9APHY|nr:ATP-dependent RNA helicase CshA (EC [Ganoderma boninense]